MEPAFWHRKWADNQIGFHQAQANPYLQRYWPGLGLPAGSRVLVPVCGKSLDLAWLGGFTFVQVHLKDPTATPLVQREQDAQFTSKFITANPDVKSLADLKGKSFAFGSISSTSGSLMPRYFMLKENDIKPESYFSRVAYSGAHDATVAWVQAGKVDGGVLNASVWQKLVDAGKVDTSKVKVFATTPAYYDYNWTVRGNMDPALKEKIKQAFLDLDPANPEHKAILDLQAASRFIETKPENYQGTEQAAREAGLLK